MWAQLVVGSPDRAGWAALACLQLGRSTAGAGGQRAPPRRALYPRPPLRAGSRGRPLTEAIAIVTLRRRTPLWVMLLAACVRWAH
jgi:hypothetical protein